VTSLTQDSPADRGLPAADTLAQVLRNHATWLESRGKNGSQAHLTGALSDSDLAGQDLRLAAASGVCLARADLTGTSLRRADLRGADLRGARGLSATQLAGADLRRAQLDPVPAWSDTLQYFKEASGRTQAILLSLVIACLYSVLTILTTRDAGLVTNSPTSTLPIIQASVPIVVFFWAGPILLLLGHAALLLSLHHQWRTGFELPSYFPDGTTPEQRANVFPVQALPYRTARRRPVGPHSRPGLLSAGWALVPWLLVPATLSVFWQRYLSRHDWTVTSIHVAVIAMSLAMTATAARRAWRNAPGLAPGDLLYATGLPHRMRRSVTALRVPLGASLVFAVASDGAIQGTPHFLELAPTAAIAGNTVAIAAAPRPSPTGDDCRRITTVNIPLALMHWLQCPRLTATVRPGWVGVGQIEASAAAWHRKWVPFALAVLGVVPYAHLEQEELSSRPIPWRFPGAAGERGADTLTSGEFGTLKPANLENRDLRNANLRSAFMVEARLRGADLSQAQMVEVKLREGDLQSSRLEQADLSRADARGARLDASVLTGARFSGADLSRAKLAQVTGERAIMDGATLTQADLRGARLHDVVLVEAKLFDVSAEGADLRRANLRGALLVGANLKRANLTGADLTDAFPWCADLRGATLTGARLGNALLHFAWIDGETMLDGAPASAATRTACHERGGRINGPPACQSRPARLQACQCFADRLVGGAPLESIYDDCAARSRPRADRALPTPGRP
jgi:uncharacterized protein YjbI with pentapeptide repeats